MKSSGTIVLASSFPRYSGDYAGAFVERLSRCYLDAGPVTVVCPYDAAVDKDHDRRLPFKIKRFRHFRGPFYASGGPENLARSRMAYPLGLGASAAMLAALLKELPKAERIVAHWALPAGLLSALVTKIKPLPLQVIMHGGGLHELLKSNYGARLATCIIKRSGDIVAVSSVIKRDLLEALPYEMTTEISDKVRVLPMGADTADFRRQDGLPAAVLEDRHVLFLGRLELIKGLDILIDALARLPYTVKLTVAGDGSQQRRLRDRAGRLGVHIEFLGQVSLPERARLLKQAPLVVLPSRSLRNGRREGLPQVALEAMAAGACLIASDSGGLLDVIKNSENALVFAEGDYKALADMINIALQNGGLRRKLGETARQKVEKYDWKVIGPQIAGKFIEMG